MRESAAGHALVLKPLFGSQGKGLQRVGAASTACTCRCRAVGGGLAYLQRFIDRERAGLDWRVFVIGGRAVAAMRRVSGWIHNVAQGAICEAGGADAELARWPSAPRRRSAWTTRASI